MTTNIDEQRFGSAFDPVLNGVAQGLARLFPPVENEQSGEPDEPGLEAAAAGDDEDASRDR